MVGSVYSLFATALIYLYVVSEADAGHHGSKLHELRNTHNSTAKGCRPKGNRRPSNLGLSSANLNVNGISVGFLPALGEPVSPSLPVDINKRIGVPMAIMGTYVQLHAKDANISHLDEQLQHYRQLEGNPVWEIAMMPVEGLEKVTPEVANNIAKRMASLNAQGITVWLRFAHEMNGDWYVWGLQPALFLEKWKLVTKAVRRVAKDTYMLWAPNSGFGDGHNPYLGSYTPYWPGEELVDMIGLSFYHYGGHGRLNLFPGPSEAQETIKDFVKQFGSKNHDRPVVLAETAASYTRSIQTGQPAAGKADERDIKLQWLKQILARSMSKEVPELKAIVWFEVLKDEDAAENTPIKSEDFRVVTSSVPALNRDAVAFLRSHHSRFKVARLGH